MKLGDLVRMKIDDASTQSFWGIGILVQEMNRFDGWDVYWSKRKSRSFHASHHLEVIDESR